MQEHITRQSEPKQPQAVTLANPFRIPMHRKKKVKKNPCQRLRKRSVIIREFFFDLRSVAAGSQNELWQGLSLFIFIIYIYYPK